MDYIEHYKKDSEEFDYFEERSGATRDDENRLREYILSKVPPQSHTILDAGCGSAWAAQNLLPSGKFVVSADISFLNVNKALKISPSSNHCGVVCDALMPPFKESAFDAVIASEIIEHTVEPENFVKKLLGIVKQRGSLLVSTPYKEKIIYTLCVHCNKKTPLHAHLHSFDENILLEYGIKIKAGRVNFSLFGNKYLIFGRTYVILRYLPFPIWKFFDNLFNKILGKPVHILVEYHK